MLNELGVRSVLLRNFNQDALENFFGAMRSLGYRNNNPTCSMFSSSYRTLLLNNLMSAHSPGGNCEEDLGEGTLASYKSLFEIYSDEDQPSIENVDDIQERVSVGPLRKTNCDSEISLELGSQTKNYIAGFVVKKLNTILFKDCKTCLNLICCTPTTNHHSLTIARDYKSDCRFLLKYPNISFCTLVQDVIKIISHHLPSICHQKNLKIQLTEIINNNLNIKIIQCPLHCDLFPQMFVNYLIKLMVFNWCSQINRILVGKTKIHENETDHIKIKAQKRYETFNKKKKIINK